MLRQETLQGVVDGENKVFTTLHNIVGIIDLFVDGSENEPSTYSFSGNTITFNVAPIYGSPIINYNDSNNYVLNKDEVLISNEIPSGVIDGVNKVFTLNNYGYRVLNLITDGSEEQGYTLNGSILTLNFAPIYNIMIDYTVNTESLDGNDFSSNSTLADILDRIYTDILKEDTNSTIYRLQLCKDLINETQRELLTDGYKDITGKKHRLTKLSFLYKKQFIDTIGMKGKILEVNGNNIKVDTTGFTSGYIYVGGDIISYGTEEDGYINSLGIRNKALKVGETVYEVFKIDVNNFKTIDVRLHGNSEIKIDHVDEFNRTNTSQVGYRILNDYYNSKFIQIIGANQGSISITYQRKIPNITESVNSIMPDDLGIRILSYIVGAEMLKLGADREQEALSAESKGLRAYEQMLQNYRFDYMERNEPIKINYDLYY